MELIKGKVEGRIVDIFCGRFFILGNQVEPHRIVEHHQLVELEYGPLYLSAPDVRIRPEESHRTAEILFSGWVEENQLARPNLRFEVNHCDSEDGKRRELIQYLRRLRRPERRPSGE